MLSFLEHYPPVVQALIAGIFTWGVTALGASFVFFNKTVSRKLLVAMLGFAAGVMIAASCWSLLVPSIELSEELGLLPWVPPVVGFLMGGLFLFVIDKIIPHLHLGFDMSEREGIKTSWQRSILLVLAITLHNIPEGLAVGVAFGAAAAGLPTATIAGAVALAIGIGLQNFPEGMAVSVPLRGEGLIPHQIIFVRSGICHCGTDRGCDWRGSSDRDASHSSVCAFFRGWSHDLCCCGGIDPGITTR